MSLQQKCGCLCSRYVLHVLCNLSTCLSARIAPTCKIERPFLSTERTAAHRSTQPGSDADVRWVFVPFNLAWATPPTGRDAFVLSTSKLIPLGTEYAAEQRAAKLDSLIHNPQCRHRHCEQVLADARPTAPEPAEQFGHIKQVLFICTCPMTLIQSRQ